LALEEAFRAWLGNAAFPWAEHLNVSYPQLSRQGV